MQYDRDKPEGENLRQGSADEPFNHKISANGLWTKETAMARTER